MRLVRLLRNLSIMCAIFADHGHKFRARIIYHRPSVLCIGCYFQMRCVDMKKENSRVGRLKCPRGGSNARLSSTLSDSSAHFNGTIYIDLQERLPNRCVSWSFAGLWVGRAWGKRIPFQYELRTPNLGCQSPSLGWIDYLNPQLSAMYRAFLPRTVK
jgi:hypothetical protein